MTTFDFQDGNGPRPAHRHVNPDGSEGGWVADTARVSGDARVSGNALVYGNALVDSDRSIMHGSFSLDWTLTIDGEKRVPHLQYGCERHSCNHWRKHAAEIVAKHNEPDEHVHHIRALCRLARLLERKETDR
jgi:hypothetical protein